MCRSLYDPATTFEPGGFHVLATGDDLALVSTGYMVHVAKEAAEILARQKVRAAVIDAYSLPINGDALLEALQRAGGRALVVEDNYGGGLGAAVAEIAARAGRLRVDALGCQRIPKSTREVSEILDYCGVSASQIADHTLAMLRGAE